MPYFKCGFLPKQGIAWRLKRLTHIGGIQKSIEAKTGNINLHACRTIETRLWGWEMREESLNCVPVLGCSGSSSGELCNLDLSICVMGIITPAPCMYNTVTRVK